jgi:hypothetical protein
LEDIVYSSYLDGHGSHLTCGFDKVCKDNDFITIYMPAYSFHILQPLDIGYFSPLKHAYRGLIKQKMHLEYNYIIEGAAECIGLIR